VRSGIFRRFLHSLHFTTMSIRNRILLALVSASCLLTISGFSAEPVAARDTATVLERGPHHKLIQTPSGGTYTELATGLCYQKDGQWIDSQEIIEILDGGATAVARQGQHQVIFSANINNPAGAVDLLTIDNKRFISKILGIAYFDAATGESALIAELKDSIGNVDPANIIVYEDAFIGSIKADVRFHYRKGSFEQDVIVREIEAGLSPATFGMNPATTRIEIWTEFFAPPIPQKQTIILRKEDDAARRAAMVVADFTDQVLDFGAMYIGSGRAFSTESEPVAGAAAIPVGKSWEKVEGARDFLIESVEYPQIRALLDKLPGMAQVAPRDPAGRLAARKNKTARTRAELLAQTSKAELRSREAKASKQGMVVAKANLPRRPGVVIDWEAVTGGTMIFKSDTTYSVTGPVTLGNGGALTTLEGGAVIKFDRATYYNQPKITIVGPISCLAASYQPVTFTGKDDDSLGEPIPGSAGSLSGTYANYALYLDGYAAGNFTLNNIRIRNAEYGIFFNGGSSHELRHAQFLNCSNAVLVGGTTLKLLNVLAYHQIGYTSGNNIINRYGSYVSTVDAHNCTFDGAAYLNNGSVGTVTLTLINCLLASIYSAGSYSGNNNSTVSSSAFQTVGAGNHYLADSAYRNAGTTAINTGLLDDLRKKTTYPPVVLTADFSLPTTLSPQAQRDLDVPDQGYHYDPIDFAWGGRTLTTSLLLTNGVAVAIYGVTGTTLGAGAKFISEGSPLNRNRLVRYQAVQEMPTAWGGTASTMSLLNVTASTAPLPEVRMRFTDISLLADTTGKRHIFENATANIISSLYLRDCQIRNGYLLLQGPYNSSGMLLELVNNLVQRANFTTTGGSPTAITVNMLNNLFLKGTLSLQGSADSHNVYDNLFDTVTLTASTFDNSNNGYISTTPLPLWGGGDKIITIPNYQSGSGLLGTNYYPASPLAGSLNDLVGTGWWAPSIIGLSHHTVLVDQTKAMLIPGGQDSIGYHYVALSGAYPVDGDGDGVPDYFEDRNGNGVADTGETSWQLYTSPNNLGSSGTGLQVLTPLK